MFYLIQLLGEAKDTLFDSLSRKSNIFFIYFFGIKAELEIFVWGPSCSINIFIKVTPHTYIHTFFYYMYTPFYLIRYIYTHPTQKKKGLVFSIKIMFNGDFS